MKLLPILLLATLNIPTVNFTEGSTYDGNKILTVDVKEEYDGTHTLNLTENYVFGHEIYDNPETDYIDGIKIDGEYATAWTIHHWDIDTPHNIEVKTVYTDDFAGALARAKAGDYSEIMKNPIMYVQMFYYLLNTASIIISIIALRAFKKNNKQVATEIDEKVVDRVNTGIDNIVSLVDTALDKFGTVVVNEIHKEYQAIIKAQILSHSGKDEDVVTLLNLLNNVSTENIPEKISEIKDVILEQIKTKKISKQTALDTISKISNKVTDLIDKYDGTSI